MMMCVDMGGGGIAHIIRCSTCHMVGRVLSANRVDFGSTCHMVGRVLSANRVDFGLFAFCFNKLSNFTPLSAAWPIFLTL